MPLARRVIAPEGVITGKHFPQEVGDLFLCLQNAQLAH